MPFLSGQENNFCITWNDPDIVTATELKREGFIEFTFQKDQVTLLVEDCFVPPKSRGQKKFRKMFETLKKIAKENHYQIIKGRIVPHPNLATNPDFQNLSDIYIHLGFTIVGDEATLVL